MQRADFEHVVAAAANVTGPKTAKAPVGWELRLERVEIPPRVRSPRHPVALCLEIHDLVLSKCAAGRERELGIRQKCSQAGRG